VKPHGLAKAARRVLQMAVTLFASALAFAMVAALVLVFNPAGLRLAYDLGHPYVPGDLVVDGLGGTLAGPLWVGDLRYRSESLALHLADVRLNWRLVRGSVVIALEAGTVEVTTIHQSPKTPPLKIALGTLSLPFPVRVTHLELKSLRINDSDPALAIEGSVAMAASRTTLDSLIVSGGGHRIQATGWLETTGDYPVELQVREVIALPDDKTLNGDTRISGSLAQLRLAQRFSGTVHGVVEGEITDLLGAPRWRANGTLEPVSPAVFDPGLDPMLAALLLSGTFSGEGDIDTQSVTAAFHLGGLRWPDTDGDSGLLGDVEGILDIQFTDRELTVSRLQITQPDTRIEINAAGTFGVDSRLLTLNAAWTGEKMPRGAGAAPLTLASSGQLSVDGSLDNYRFEGHTALTLPDRPRVRIRTSGSGNLKGIALATASLDAASSQMAVRGRLTWAPELSGSVDIELDDIDPGLLWPAWPGQLTGKASLHGSVTADGLVGGLSLHRLSGTLRGFPVSAQVGLSRDATQITIHDGLLTSAHSRVAVSGAVARDWNLKFSINSGHLAELLPDAGGGLISEGQLTGPRQHPVASAHFEGKKLRYREYRMEHLRLVANLDTGRGGNLDLTAEASELHAIGGPWRRVEVHIDGEMERHRITLQAAQDGLAVEATAAGSLDQRYLWRGDLSQALLRSARLGTWRLRAPTALMAGPTRADIQQLCFEQTRTKPVSSVCTQFALNGSDWRGEVIVSSLPFTVFDAIWPQRLSMSGDLSARFAAQRSAQSPVQGSGKIETTGGAITWGTPSTTIKYAPSSATFNLDPRGLEADIDWHFVDAGVIQGNIRLPGWDSAAGDHSRQALSGMVHIRTTALPLISLVSVDLANIEGTINSDLRIGGTLGTPEISGRADLTDASADLPELGVKLTHIQLALAVYRHREIDIRGSLRSGDGRLDVRGGFLADPEAGWPLQLVIHGEHLQVIDTREANVIASPKFQIKAANARIDIDGEVRIPRARLTPRKVPEEAVTVSTDATIVSRDSAESTQRDTASATHAQVRVILGDDIRVDGLGLRGRLDGELLIVDTPEKPSEGRGTIRIHDGFYTAYGQNLRIDGGRLLFAGAMDNPGLDVRAVRTVASVTAGIHATGTVRSPQLKLFSTPPMADSDALAYILLGRPLNQASSSDGGMLMAAANGMGLGKGEEMAKSIGRSLGLDEVRINSGGDSGTTDLVVGRQLSTKLYIRYLAGLFGTPGRVQLRYQLRPHIELQSETGAGAGADLFYTIER